MHKEPLEDILFFKKLMRKTRQFSIEENNLLIEVIFWRRLINSKQVLLQKKKNPESLLSEWSVLIRLSLRVEEGRGALSSLLLPCCDLRFSKRFSLKERMTNFSSLRVLTMYRFCFSFCQVTSRLCS